MTSPVILGLTAALAFGDAASAHPVPAHAEPTAPGPTSLPSGRRSESTAESWSRLGTALSAGIGTAFALDEGTEIPAAVLFGSGVIVGPSLGYLYGHCPGHAAQGYAIRIGLSGLAVVAVEEIVRANRDTSGSDFTPAAEVLR